jgi:hypothetical protein
MASDSGEPDAAALRDRVDQLEQTVAEQQATIESLSSPTASRRGVLAALTGVAGAGALGAYSQRGAAQAAGQVGTSSEPVDVFANAIDANAVETDNAVIGGQSSDLHYEKINSVNVNLSRDESVKVDVGNVKSYQDYKIFYSIDPRDNDGGIGLRINNNSTSSYDYFDESGNKTQDSKFLLVESIDSAAASAQGWLSLTSGEQAETGIFNEIHPQRSFAISGFATKGGFRNSRSVQSVTFYPLGSGAILQDVYIDVFGRDR